MKSLAVIFLFLHASSAFLLNFSKSLEYSCENLHRHCVLHNVVLETESDLEKALFQNITDPLTIASGRIPHFTRKLAEKLSGIVDLAINGLEMQSLYVKPEMTHLEATGNRISVLEVDGDLGKTYQMLTLNLSGNKLRDVKVLSRFRKLHQLTLDGNQLDRLSMDLFEGMTDLRKLSLANNLIDTLDSSKKVQLLKLQSLSLAGNKLIELDEKMFDFPSLKQLDVSNNKLYSFGGSLNSFNALEEVKLAANFWDCDFVDSVAPMKTLKLDEDEPNRCRELGLAMEQKICCTRDTTSFISDLKHDYGIFNDKWELLSNLKKLLDDFKNATEKKMQQIGELPEDRSLIERIKQMELEQQQILDKVNDRHESVALKDIEDLRTIIADHKKTIGSLESKLSEAESQQEILVERLNDFRNSVNEKFEKLEGIPEKLQKIEQVQTDQAALLKTTTNETRAIINDLEKQEFRYHLSTVEWKNKIVVEQGRLSKMNVKLIADNEELRKQVDRTNEKVDTVWRLLDSITDTEGKEY